LARNLKCWGMSNKLNILLSPKPTDEQRMANEHTRYLFIMAMMNMDDKMLMRVLAKNGVFFGNMNNWQAAHWLRGKFKNFDICAYHSKFKFGFSNEIYPGAEVLEFTYSDADFGAENEDTFQDLFLEESKQSKKRELKLRFVALFKESKIVDLRLVKNMLCHKTIQKLQKDN
jgi:hypothetical protein